VLQEQVKHSVPEPYMITKENSLDNKYW